MLSNPKYLWCLLPETVRQEVLEDLVPIFTEVIHEPKRSGSALHSTVEVVNPLLQVVPVCVPCHSVHAGSGHSFEFEVAVLEHFRSNVVQKGGKP